MTATYYAEAGPLWAVTSYFNPLRYWRRRHNYRLFRQHLQLPLLTVELDFGTGCELTDDDAEILLRCSGGDVMWQKERLLNIAWDTLPASCRYVVWIDCDVLFLQDNWAAALLVQLEAAPLVQPFARVLHVRPDVPIGAPGPGDISSSKSSVASLIGGGVDAANCLGNFRGQRKHSRAPGHAWAARREVLARHGLYDACITGGGDAALAAAAYGLPDEVVRFHGMNARQASHYLAWAEPFYQLVQGNVGWLEGDLLHLWHGDREDRHIPQRYYDLQPFAFDPAIDIVKGRGGCWQWNSDKPGLHACLQNYFAVRNEDGAARHQEAA
jgi:hypothetical protein